MSNRTRTSRRWSVLGVVTALVLVAAACSGDDSGNGSSDGDVGTPAENAAAAFDCPVGAHTEAGGPVRVNVWHAYNALTQETLEEIAAAYNESQDQVTVTVEAQGTYEELLKKYEDALGDPDTLPDIVFAEDTNSRFLIDSATVLPAASCIEADEAAGEFYDDLLPAISNAYTVEGALWPAAYGVSMPIMYVNDDHLRTAGVDVEDYPATLDELRTAAEKIKAAGLPGLESPVTITTQGWFVENWLTGAGTAIVGDGNGRDALTTDSQFDNPDTLAIFEWLHEMSADGLLKILPDGGADQFFTLARQTSSILIDGSRAITPVVAVIDSARADLAGVDVADLGDADLQGLDVNVAPIPGLADAGQGGVAGSAGWLVGDDRSEDRTVAAAWDFFRFFNSQDNQVRWALQGSYMPVTQAVRDDARVVDEFESTRGGRWLSTTYEQLRGLDADFPMPVFGPFKEFRSGVRTLMEDMARPDTDPAAAITEFDASFTAALESYAAEVGG